MRNCTASNKCALFRDLAPLQPQSHLRREPTPFPKEMRAMAKRMQNLRQTGKEAALAGSVMMSHGGSEYRRDTKFQSL